MRMNLKLKDWQERALKTFVQALGGIVVPEVIFILNNIDTVKTFNAAWTLLFPAICSGIAAGISAVWNIALNRDNAERRKEDSGDDAGD